jgi:hypothetical protein
MDNDDAEVYGPLRYVLDRHEDNGWSVLERADGETFLVPTAWLPEEAVDGHTLKVEVQAEGKDSRLHISIDEDTTAARARRIQEIRDRLRQQQRRTPGKGDLEL